MSNNIKGLLNGLGNVSSLFSHIHSATSMISALRGHDVAANSPAVAQGLSGVFGKGDERKLQILFSELTSKEKEVLTGFFNWHFAGETYQDKILAMWYMSSFRVFVTGIKNSNVPVASTKTTTTIPGKDGAKTESVTETKDFADEYGKAVAFLREILRLIRLGVSRHKRAFPESSKEDRLQAGYREVLNFFKATGVPCMPPKSEHDWLDWTRAVGTKTLSELKAVYNNGVEAVHTAHDKEMEQIEHPTLFQRLITNPLLKLIS